MKRENISQVKAQEYLFLGAAPNHLRDTVRVLAKHRTLLITRQVTWQGVSPAPSVPAQVHDSLSQEEGSEADDESTSDRGVWGVLDDNDGGLDRLNDLGVTSGLDLHAVLQSH